MSSLLRVGLLSAAASLSIGCSFFSLGDDAEPSKLSGSAGKPSSGGTGGTGMSGSGTAGTGTGGSIAGTGGTGAGMGGTGAGTGGGTAGSAVGGMAGSGMAGGAGAPIGGTGGDVATGGMGAGGSGMAGSPAGSGGSGPVTCDSLHAGAKAFAGHCYLLVTDKVNWNAAKSACSGMNAHLVTISSEAPLMQSDFDAENSYVFATLGGSQETWIGCTDGGMDHDPGTGAPYTWIDGEAMTLDNWNSGEPNNYNKNCMDNSSCYEHCGFMMTDPAGKWNDDLCEVTKQYVCEWDMDG